MKHFEHPLKHKPSELLWRMMLAFSVFLFVCGLVLSPWDTLLPGLAAIHRSPDAPISDYFVIGGMGAAMLNAGLVTLASLLLARGLGLTYSGLSVAAILIMGGFALFGKNLVNCLPILFGNWLFARYQEEKWNKYIVIGLFSTCLAPFVSFLYNALSTALWLRVAAAAGIGVVIGFVVPALAPQTASFHMGYNLFNVGFAAGFVAIALMSVLRGFQLDSGSVMIWQKGFPPLLTGLCLGALVLLFVWGWRLSDRELRRLGRITRHSGRAAADFVFMDGVGPTFMNMAVMGPLAIGWLWLVGGVPQRPHPGRRHHHHGLCRLWYAPEKLRPYCCLESGPLPCCSATSPLTPPSSWQLSSAWDWLPSPDSSAWCGESSPECSTVPLSPPWGRYMAGSTSTTTDLLPDWWH